MLTKKHIEWITLIVRYNFSSIKKKVLMGDYDVLRLFNQIKSLEVNIIFCLYYPNKLTLIIRLFFLFFFKIKACYNVTDNFFPAIKKFLSAASFILIRINNGKLQATDCMMDYIKVDN